MVFKMRTRFLFIRVDLIVLGSGFKRRGVSAIEAEFSKQENGWNHNLVI